MGRARGSAAGTGALLERDQEVALLRGLIGQAAAADAALAVVEGPAGIGKTALVAEARRLGAAAGFTVLSARCGDLERDLGFGVVRQLFEPAVAAGPVRLLRGAAAAAGPGLGHVAERADGQPAVTGDPSFASLHGLYWLTMHLCERAPVLLAVDDLHWCDAPSLRFLAYLAPRLAGMPVLLAVSLRPGEPEAGQGRGLLAAVAGDPAAVLVRPRPLTVEATAELVRSRLGQAADPGFTAACHRATGGNPLLLGELMRVLSAEEVTPDAAHLPAVSALGPGSVSRAVFLRLARLPPDAAKVAAAVAVLGDGADLGPVAALAGLDDQSAGQAVDALARAEILRPGPPLGFAHPLLAAAVYEDILPGERQLRHRRAAELLWAAGAPPGQVARHLLYAPESGQPWVVEALRVAAEEAARAGAADTAVCYLSRALAEPPDPGRRPGTLLALGRVETLTRGKDAAGHLREAYGLFQEPAERSAAAQLLGRALLVTVSPAEAAQVARQAAAELPAQLGDLRAALEAFQMFCVLFGAGDRTALRRLERYRDDLPPPSAGPGVKMLAAITAQAWMYECGPADKVSELSLAALAGGDLIAADNGLLANCPITNLTLADREEAEQWWDTARADAHRRGSLLGICSVSLWRGHMLWRRGELAEAEASLRSCLDELDRWGYDEPQARIYGVAHLTAVLAERGDLPAARTLLERSHDRGGTDDGTRYWLTAKTGLLLAEGSYAQAAEAARDYGQRFSQLVPNPMDAPWRSHRALALGHLGRRDEGIELAEAELELARAWGAPGTVARTLHSLGTLKHGSGIGHLEEAAAITAATPARLEHAKALAALGRALRRHGKPARAREPLQQAMQLATSCGADRLAGQARTELYAAGARPRSSTITGPGSLTASERRVAELAAQGRTNREAAEALFVTPKTIEMHLGNAYRKLGISSRHQLPAALDETPQPRSIRPG